MKVLMQFSQFSMLENCVGNLSLISSSHPVYILLYILARIRVIIVVPLLWDIEYYIRMTHKKLWSWWQCNYLKYVHFLDIELPSQFIFYQHFLVFQNNQHIPNLLTTTRVIKEGSEIITKYSRTRIN